MISVRKVRRNICLLFAALLLFTGVAAAARGTADKEEPLSISFSAPESASPGDTVTVLLTLNKNIPDAMVILFSGEDKAITTAHTFPLGGSKKTGYRAVALIPLNSLQKSGIYRLEIHHGEVLLSQELRIDERVFVSETIPLDDKNTAIKSDNSDKRIEQINELTGILLTVSADAPIFPGPYLLPVKSTRRTSGYGDRRIYRYSNGETQRSIHFGIDFGIPSGTPVFSTGDGRVVFADTRITTGWTVVVEHMPGVYSLYYHLDSLSTTVGEFVRAGTLIGKSGSTGLSTGPHLHWEIRVHGESVDPDRFVERILF